MSKIYNFITINRVRLILGTAILIYTVVFSWLSIQRQNAFFSGFDLGNMDQTIWNTLHGHLFSLTNGNQNQLRFSIHADMILILLSPIYLLWDNVNFLLIIQSLIIALGAIPVYLLSKKLLKHTFLAFVMVSVYLLHPSLEWANIYDFHTITIAAPIIITSYYFAYTKKIKLFYLFVILALLCREDVSLIVGAMGIIIFFFLQNRRLGIITALLGICWFFFDLGFLIPTFSSGHEAWSLSFYQLQGGDSTSQPTLTSTFSALIAQSGDLLISGYAFKYYFLVLKPFAFLPLLGLPFILPAIPIILLNVLSSKAFMTSSILHYESGIIPFFTISTIYSFVFIRYIISKNKKLKKHTAQIMLVAGAILFVYVLRDNYTNSPLPISPNCYCVMYTVTQNDINFANELDKIPQNASVDSSPEIRPHISHRLYAYSFPYGLTSSDYFAIITRNQMIGSITPKIYELDLIQKLERSKKYKIIYHQSPYYLFKKL